MCNLKFFTLFYSVVRFCYICIYFSYKVKEEIHLGNIKLLYLNVTLSESRDLLTKILGVEKYIDNINMNNKKINVPDS